MTITNICLYQFFYKESELRSSSSSSLPAQVVSPDSASFGIGQLMYNLNKQSVGEEDAQSDISTVLSSANEDSPFTQTPVLDDHGKR